MRINRLRATGTGLRVGTRPPLVPVLVGAVMMLAQPALPLVLVLVGVLVVWWVWGRFWSGGTP